MSYLNPLTGLPYSDKYKELEEKSKELPVTRPEILAEFKQKLIENDVLIFMATTGAGKSVRVPIEAFKTFKYRANIGMTEPRTLNTHNIAHRLADGLDVPIGSYVGYKYSFDEKLSPQTKLLVMTDALMVNNLLDDPEKYDLVIIDEVHERNINIDIILMIIKRYLLRFYEYTLQEQELSEYGVTLEEILNRSKAVAELQRKVEKHLVWKPMRRKPVKFLLLSATIKLSDYLNYFNTIPGVKVNYMFVKGRTKPIIERYMEDIYPNGFRYRKRTKLISKKYEEPLKALLKMLLTHPDHKKGDILVFLPTKKKIDVMIKEFTNFYEKVGRPGNLLAIGLFRGMKNQELATSSTLYKQKGYTRKLVFATPIAETGVTVDGVIYVIETGVANHVTLDQKTGITYSKVGYITKASATQRCGRVGRTQPGICFRLYTKDTFANQFPDNDIPEILRTNLFNNLLKIINTMQSIQTTERVLKEFLSPPDPEIVKIYMNKMYRDGILVNDYFTDFGKVIYSFQMDYDLSLLLAKSFMYKVPHLMIPIVALMMSSGKNVKNCFIDKEELLEQEDEEPVDELTPETVREYYRNPYGDPIVYLKLFKHFYTDFFLNNYKEPRNKYIFNLKEWCTENMLNFGVFETVVDDMKDIEKTINLIADGKFIIKDFPKMDKDQNPEEKIIKAFMEVYSDNRAALIEYEERTIYSLESGDIVEEIPDFFDDPPKLIGFAGLHYAGTTPFISCVFKVFTKI